jgi:hypothetical protein
MATTEGADSREQALPVGGTLWHVHGLMPILWDSSDAGAGGRSPSPPSFSLRNEGHSQDQNIP